MLIEVQQRLSEKLAVAKLNVDSMTVVSIEGLSLLSEDREFLIQSMQETAVSRPQAFSELVHRAFHHLVPQNPKLGDFDFLNDGQLVFLSECVITNVSHWRG